MPLSHSRYMLAIPPCFHYSPIKFPRLEDRTEIIMQDRILRKADELSCLSSRINVLHYRLVGLNRSGCLDLLLQGPQTPSSPPCPHPQLTAQTSARPNSHISTAYAVPCTSFPSSLLRCASSPEDLKPHAMAGTTGWLSARYS